MGKRVAGFPLQLNNRITYSGRLACQPYFFNGGYLGSSAKNHATACKIYNYKSPVKSQPGCHSPSWCLNNLCAL